MPMVCEEISWVPIEQAKLPRRRGVQSENDPVDPVTAEIERDTGRGIVKVTNHDWCAMQVFIKLEKPKEEMYLSL